MSDEKKMDAKQAVDQIKAIGQAKQEGTTKPDSELAKKLEEATKALVEANKRFALEDERKKQIEAEEKAKEEEAKKQKVEKREEPSFRGVGSEDSVRRYPQQSYKALIQKRARSDEQWLRQLQEWNDDVLIAGLAMGKTPEQVLKTIPTLREFMEIELGNSANQLAKALAAANTGAGLEWIPEVFSPELQDLIRVERVLARAFRRFAMPQATVRLPQLTQEFAGFVVAESTANTPYNVPSIVSDAGTSNVLLQTVELAVASIFSKTFEEDSIIPALPEIRRRIIEGMAKAIEDAIINGSETVPHPDGDVSASDPATAWDGLRADARGSDFSGLTLATNLNGANMTVDNLLTLIRQQGRFGARPGESFWLTSPQGMTRLMGLRDAGGNNVLMQVQQIGEAAILIRGAIGKLMGRDVVVSDLVKTNVDASGVVPATPTIAAQTELYLVNREAFLIGDRRRLTIESDTAPLTRQRILVATVRQVFERVKPSQDANLDNPVVIGSNIETS